MRLHRLLPGFLRRWARLVAGAWSEIYLSFIRDLDGEFGARLRHGYYKKRLRALGDQTLIDTGVYMRGLEHISIGNHTHIDKDCLLFACPPDLDLSKRALLESPNRDIDVVRGSLTIGDHCHLAPANQIHAYGGVVIGDHCAMATGTKIFSLTSLPYNPFDPSQITFVVPYDGVSPTMLGPVELGRNVMVGVNACIFPGVKIGAHSFVRTNAVVLKSFAENSSVAGDPAILQKKRFRLQVQ